MPFRDHLGEFRKRIIWVLIFFVISMIAGFVLAPYAIQILKNDPAAAYLTWNVFGLSDALRIYIQIAFVISIVLTVPFFLFHLWRFVSPALLPDEKRVIAIFLPFSLLLFIVGIFFGYYILFPMVVGFMSNIAKGIGAQEVYGLAQYFGFMFNIVLPFGFLFEMPLVVMLLTRLDIIHPDKLIKLRRVAYFILVVVAVTITPPEIISDVLVTIPLLVLYELSVWLSKVVYRRRLKALEEWEKGYPS
ncbi:twin-arginine translocase subunit TatC [Microaerobacter geothermalis]|uniref:twin-arginine translocase subunit TatC n=1 Tax=Microaerobacter geothermalis TaxID=674972 RepID=UPI001F379A99|nr:twin-arginine translocase subunit TatC [Microaerobacter geothermalis]MCF6095240.1 twin-arginine translocase subunit TatC [Microaerobacter geothermalis]